MIVAVAVMAAMTMPVPVAMGTVGPPVMIAISPPDSAPVRASIRPAVDTAVALHFAVAVVMPLDTGASVPVPTVPAFAGDCGRGGE